MRHIWLIIKHLFLAVITVKFFNGFIEVISGYFLLSYGRLVEREVYILTNYEITDSTINFVAYYLLFHGFMNFVLVIALWKRRLWAFPLSVVFFTVIVFYQFYRFYYNHSMNLLFVTILDSFVIILTLLEYKRLKANY